MNEQANITGTLAAGMVQVCAYCYPGLSIFYTHKEWALLGLQISHGACPACRNEVMSNMRERPKNRQSEWALHQDLLKVPLHVARAAAPLVTSYKHEPREGYQGAL